MFLTLFQPDGVTITFNDPVILNSSSSESPGPSFIVFVASGIEYQYIGVPFLVRKKAQ